ncbi:MAG: Crp/Fnr family transcriptional regulator [Syntrophus sp. (in: bacteria)]|nr:Crp/Fnr family transcriptional regulator [Syntrophus sp. (in: bacteria)]
MSVLFINQIPLFAPLSAPEQEVLASLLRKRSIRKGDFLFHKGDEGTALYIIYKGLIKIAVPAGRGEEVTLAILTDGDFFGEMALLDDMPRSADATALEDTQLYVLNRADFLSFLIHNEHAVRAIIQVLSLRLRRTDDMVAEVCFLNVSARLAKRLAALVESRRQADKGDQQYEVHLTQRELAGLIGVSRETINKELKILRDKRIVSIARNSITVNDLARLKNRIR